MKLKMIVAARREWYERAGRLSEVYDKGTMEVGRMERIVEVVLERPDHLGEQPLAVFRFKLPEADMPGYQLGAEFEVEVRPVTPVL